MDRLWKQMGKGRNLMRGVENIKGQEAALKGMALETREWAGGEVINGGMKNRKTRDDPIRTGPGK